MSGVISNLPDNNDNIVTIKVFGVGGGGNNAVNRMVETGIRGATLVAVNTDIPVLRRSKADEIIAIGESTTRGRGAGANPEIGREAAEESRELIKRSLEGVDMLYITAGMGGGTGTGAAPVIARIAKEMHILTVAVVTRPFAFEGVQRSAVAEDGIERLKQYVDALIVVSNERLREISKVPISFKNAFAEADNVLISSVRSICELIATESYVNLDFADVTAILKDSGEAHIGIGVASGPDKAEVAARQAISSPLLDSSISSAEGIIISITADEEVQLEEITATSAMITEQIPSAKIIWGIDFDPELEDSIQIVVIATKSSSGAIKSISEDDEEQHFEDDAADKTESLEDKADDGANEGVISEENAGNGENKEDIADKELRKTGKPKTADWLFTPEEFEKIRTVVNFSDKK
ncbi:MAG: cell division protein FtsZ [Clostridia bacterium]|nr:cell division protein FtsZ [Clostridia bacterium]